MSYSGEWDARYAERTHMSTWPWSDLVSCFHRYAGPFSPQMRVMEIGFGAGANIPFFRALGVTYCGIEGSKTIHAEVSTKFPSLAHRLYLGDFVLFDFPESYDIVVDRAAMTHNSTAAIREGLRNLARHMPVGGKYLGIDWFSTRHSDFTKGEPIDAFTKSSLPEGQFVGVGNVHFSDEAHIVGLFSDAGLRVTMLEHKECIAAVPKVGHVFASWNLVAEKVAALPRWPSE